MDLAFDTLLCLVGTKSGEAVVEFAGASYHCVVEGRLSCLQHIAQPADFSVGSCLVSVVDACLDIVCFLFDVQIEQAFLIGLNLVFESIDSAFDIVQSAIHVARSAKGIDEVFESLEAILKCGQPCIVEIIVDIFVLLVESAALENLIDIVLHSLDEFIKRLSVVGINLDKVGRNAGNLGIEVIDSSLLLTEIGHPCSFDIFGAELSVLAVDNILEPGNFLESTVEHIVPGSLAGFLNVDRRDNLVELVGDIIHAAANNVIGIFGIRFGVAIELLGVGDMLVGLSHRKFGSNTGVAESGSCLGDGIRSCGVLLCIVLFSQSVCFFLKLLNPVGNRISDSVGLVGPHFPLVLSDYVRFSILLCEVILKVRIQFVDIGMRGKLIVVAADRLMDEIAPTLVFEVVVIVVVVLDSFTPFIHEILIIRSIP